MRRFVLVGIVAVAALALSVPAMAASKGGKNKVKTWEITVENLTVGQPISPPLAVVHAKKVDVFSVGEIASHGGDIARYAPPLVCDALRAKFGKPARE